MSRQAVSGSTCVFEALVAISFQNKLSKGKESEVN